MKPASRTPSFTTTPTSAAGSSICAREPGPNTAPSAPPDSESTLVLALTAQIGELQKRHRRDVQALREALEQAHGENLDLRRELTRRGAGIGPSTNHVASIATTS